MTAQAHLDHSIDDGLIEVVGDAALLALLRGKPSDDEIPTAVWWLIAETLRTSVALRRTLAVPGQEQAAALADDALLLTEAALEELVTATGAHPTPVEVRSSRADGRYRRGFGLQLSILFLARMLVSHTPTAPTRLANTLAAHLRALSTLESSPPAELPAGQATSNDSGTVKAASIRAADSR